VLDERRQVNLVLAGVALLAVAGLYVASQRVSGSFSALLIGLASSIGAISFYALVAALNALVIDRQKVRFFGPELVRGQTLMVCPDFEIDIAKLEPGTDPALVLKRASKEQRERLLPPGISRGLGMGNLATFARPDIQAALQLAGVFEVTRLAPHEVITDTEMMEQHAFGSAVRPARSFISIGLSSNDLTLCYVSDPDTRLLELDVAPDHELALRPRGRGLYYNTVDRVYGACVRYSATMPSGTSHYYFLCGGLRAEGTRAAATYLALSWRELARRAGPHQDFVAIVSQPRSGGPPSLEVFHTEALA
jgi:hypothetical protein